MTRLTFTPGNHIYRLDGTPVASVTTILKQLDKPALVNWAANQSAGYAVDNWDRLTDLPPSQRYTDIAKQWRGTRDKAAATGTQIHAWGDAILNGDPVDIPYEYADWVQGFADWWTGSGLTSVDRECMVWSDTDDVAGPAYAGRFDLLATHPQRGLGLLDIKSGSGVYEEAAIQCAGYALADTVVTADGTDEPMPLVTWLGVIHTRPQGTSLHVVPTDMQAAAYDKWALLRLLHGVGTIRLEQVIA